MKKAIRNWTVCLLLFALAGYLSASENTWYQYQSGLGADGYDLVSYFNNSSGGRRPQKGLANYSAKYDGITWHFANAENRAKFLANPTQYLPQYGGHCAYAAAKQSLAYGDPIAWTIEDNKLYFNYNQRIKKKWESTIDLFITKGDQYWSTRRKQ